MQSIKQWLQLNWKSALAVTMINIPLCISLAIASGATPLMGLLTGVWSSIFAAIFCSSKHNIYGPAGSLAGILLPIAMMYGVQYIPLLAIGWGLVIVLFAALRLTKYITLIPWSALQWFLLGIGLIIGLQQLPSALWLNLDYSLMEAIRNIAETNWIALVTFLWAFGVLKLCKKFVPSVPGAVVVTVLWVILGKIVAAKWFSLDLLVDRFDNVSFTLFQLFEPGAFKAVFADPVLLKTLIVASIWVWVISILETLISAKIAAKDTRVPYEPRKEIFGLGITNVLTWVLWGLPSSALVVRTGMNMSNGATSKLSGGLVGVFTMIIAAFLFSNALQFLPFAVIAAILIDVSLGMINLSLYHKMWSVEKISILIILLVWVISYIWDPMLWILVGAVMALLRVVRRTMDADLVANVFRDGHHFKKLPLVQYAAIQEAKDVLIIKLEGELNYLSIESHIAAMQWVTETWTIILSFGHTSIIDQDAQEEIDHQIEEWLNNWKNVYITGLEEQTLMMMQSGSTYGKLNALGHIKESKSALLEELLG